MRIRIIIAAILVIGGIVVLLSSCTSSSAAPSVPQPVLTHRVKVKDVMGKLQIRVVDKMFHVGDVLGDYTTIVEEEKPGPDMLDYQLAVSDDTIYVYDGDRLVGNIPYSDTDSLSQLVVHDNQ